MEQDLYRINSTGEIYLYLFDQYWYIANEATLYGVFGSNPDISALSSLPADAQLGPVISGGSCLFQPTGSQGILFMCTSNLTAYLIGSMPALEYYQFNGPLQTTGNQVLSDWIMAITTMGETISLPG